MQTAQRVGMTCTYNDAKIYFTIDNSTSAKLIFYRFVIFNLILMKINIIFFYINKKNYTIIRVQDHAFIINSTDVISNLSFTRLHQTKNEFGGADFVCIELSTANIPTR